MPSSGNKSEFGGGPGMVQEEQWGTETFQQQTWELYATNPSGTDGSETLDVAREHIGEPNQSYTPGDAA
jgi:hypothetical protein